MKKTVVLSFLFILFTILDSPKISSWGFYGHKKINNMAVFTLPPAMIGFYKKHIDFITEHAVDADSRRSIDEQEAPRHFIDIDRYGDHPFDSIPMLWEKAVVKYSEDSLKAHGIVPWHIQVMLGRLTFAFKENNINKILRYSADIGHYVADAHVPLHTTKNYNGQLTNQKGIHGFWESRIPELKGNEYDYFVGRAKYIDKSQYTAWQIVRASFAAKDSVLNFEASLNSRFDSDKKYSYETRGAKNVKVYSIEYANEYDRMLNGMVERRMREAILMVGSYWYTAWVNAGQPDLDKLVEIDTFDTTPLDTIYPPKQALQGKGHEE
ncbi:MAG: S1/P1 Nuclease [Bacteroidetes bacterium]|nr:S1/P1 Nuclease [Bacteroidota bacterium]